MGQPHHGLLDLFDQVVLAHSETSKALAAFDASTPAKLRQSLRRIENAHANAELAFNEARRMTERSRKVTPT